MILGFFFNNKKICPLVYDIKVKFFEIISIIGLFNEYHCLKQL